MLEFPKSWFDCQFPRAEEEIVWSKHPILPIECSQYGNIRGLEEDIEIIARGRKDPIKNLVYQTILDDDLKKTNYIGKREKLIKECWEKKIIPESTKLIYWNLNPLDNRPENILIYKNLSNYLINDYKERKNIFVSNTISEMIKRQIDVPSDRNINDYWIFIGIPRMHIRGWRAKVKQISKIE